MPDSSPRPRAEGVHCRACRVWTGRRSECATRHSDHFSVSEPGSARRQQLRLASPSDGLQGYDRPRQRAAVDGSMRGPPRHFEGGSWIRRRAWVGVSVLPVPTGRCDPRKPVCDAAATSQALGGARTDRATRQCATRRDRRVDEVVRPRGLEGGLPAGVRVVAVGGDTDKLLPSGTSVRGLELRGWLEQVELDALLARAAAAVIPQRLGFGALTRLL